MSSSFIVEPRDNAPHKDETLIIMVDDNGTLSVDQEIFQNLIMTQASADISVVKLGKTQGDGENGGITLTVDPPRPATKVSSETTTTTSTTTTTTTTTTSTTTTTEGTSIVDPFMEMDPEQLERLETALQSEEAKQILGENVTAMLDMLTVEERQNSLKHSIELDHCYTSRRSPAQPKPTDPLPIANSPEGAEVKHVIQTTSSSATSTPSPSPTTIASAANLKATKTLTGRPRRSATAASFIGTPKTAVNVAPRNAQHPHLQEKGAHKQNDDEADEEDSSLSLSESSESDSPSDNDSDFGPRGPRRSGVRARGGRKGLTTRGGSMAARRRGSNKRMDIEQVRRLDLEMAAAVDAMKSPEKEEKTDKVNLTKAKKPRTSGGKKKEEPPPISIVTPEASPVEKPLQTTNQVKANLINANMIKGDMILTKPGEARNNQKVIFVQKQIVLKANEMKLGLKKSPIIIPKGKLINQSSSSPKITTKDGKLVSIPVLPKSVMQSSPGSQPRIVTLGQLQVPESNQVTQQPQILPQQSHQQTPKHIPQYTPKHKPQHPPQHTPKNTSQFTSIHTSPQTPQHTPQQHQQPITPSQSKVQTLTTSNKPKLLEVKKEKKKAETVPEVPPKTEEIAKVPEVAKVPEIKGTPDAAKKHVKKEQKKSPAVLAEALGPALFSTPDIIRRVSVGSESKNLENPTTSTTPLSSPVVAPVASQSIPIVQSIPVKSVETTPPKTLQVSPKNVQILKNVEPVQTTSAAVNLEAVTTAVTSNSAQNVETNMDLNTLSQPLPLVDPMDVDSQNSQVSLAIPKDQKIEVKAPPAEEFQPSLDSVVPEDVSDRMEQLNVPNDIVSKQSGNEGEEHLLATLEMEASKHEDELLTEALLLHEELGVDLASGLVSTSVSEPLLSPSTFASPALAAKEPEVKASETPSAEMIKQNLQSEQSKKKDEKEPIQIIRGGRVITLPPIEAPATRSKKLQARNDSPQHKREAVPKPEKLSKPTIQELIQREEMESEADDDEFEDEVDNSDSEDDPDRLWCICKRPHNNRFMICCDVCEDWFHGKCVHVSKAMGQQMEEQGIEWVCPNCTKKKAEETKGKQASPLTSKCKSTEALFQTLDGKSNEASPSRNVTIADGTSAAEKTAAQGSGITQCVVCKKEARNSSIYCSDTCILAHAEETWPKDKPVPVPQPKTPKQEVPKAKPEGRVMVFERKTGKVFTGADAPTTSNLKTWLKEHPSFEVVRPNNFNTFKIGGKTVTAIQTLESSKQIKLSQQEKSQLHPKMVFAKVPGMKQTVLAASTKKTILVPAAQNSPPPIKIKVPPSPKRPVLKQTTIKTAPPQKVQTPTIKPVKKQESKTPIMKQQPLRSPLPRKSETEPIRVNVRKTMADSLSTRIKATSDLKLTQEEISDLALNIELELYKYFKDTGAKYKAKYRSLVFNIKDTKNLTLFRKIADRSLTPDAVVRLSPEEMASQELAEWRKKETKHQLEMIKKNELDLMAQAKSIVVKTHKGEQVIENDRSDPVDPKTSVQDIVTALNSGNNINSKMDYEKKVDSKEEMKKSKLEKKKDKDKESRSRNRETTKKRDRSKSRHRHSRDRDHSKTREKSKDRKSIRNKDSKKEKDRDRDKDKERDKDRGRDREKEKDKKHKRSKSKNRKSHKDHKEKDKKDEEKKKDLEKKKDPTPPPLEKSIEDRLWRHIDDETTTNTFDGNDSDLSDREPSSTVNIKTPDINEDLEREKDPEAERERERPRGPLQTVWRGFVSMPDVAKFFITAQEVSGQARDLMEDLPDTVDVVGRIGHETVWDYISKMKKNGTKEILVIRLTAANDEEKIPYITLYSYLNSRSRLGVVGNVSKNIKDFYIMPFSNLSQVPNVLLPLDGPGFEEQRPPLLLGIIVRNKRKRAAPPSVPVMPAKIAKKDLDRSYTPPLVLPSKEKNSTPPSSPKSLHKGIAESLPEKVVTQQTLENLNKAHIGMSRTVIGSATISKIVPELSSKIDLTSTLSKTQDEDDDEPYSPGQMDDDGDDSLKAQDTPVLAESKNANNELQRKMDELNRQIEEQKQQIQNISSSFLGDASNTLPGLGLDPGTTEGEDAYSPSDTRSFTPPPQGLTKFSQPILDKVSDITIPPNLQEILANVKRQETTKVDPYLPSKPGASFLTSVNTRGQKSDKYTPFGKGATSTRFNEKCSEGEFMKVKETKTSTLSSMSELDLIKKAAEQLASEPLPPTPVTLPPGLFSTILPPPTPAVPPPLPPPPPATTTASPSPSSTDSIDNIINYPPKINDSFKTNLASNQPRPPGLEDDDEIPSFLSQPTTPESPSKTALPSKFPTKSGVVLSVKRKLSESESPSKSPRTKSRWGQPPSD